MEVCFTIPGKPFGKQRIRVTRSGNVYTPEQTVSFENLVGTIAAPLFHMPLSGPVGIRIRATFEIPKSWNKAKKAAHANRPHAQKPDLDNIEKAIADGLNRVAFEDDKQIASMDSAKFWGPKAQTVVWVWAI